MALSSRKHKEEAGDAITDINVTPLVDVCLVLVIIFMVIAPFAVKAGIQSLQAQAQAGVGKVAASENVRVRLSRDGNLTVNGKASGWDRLFNDIGAILPGSKDKMVIVSADDSNRVEEVVAVMDTAKQAGAVKVAMLKN